MYIHFGALLWAELQLMVPLVYFFLPPFLVGHFDSLSFTLSRWQSCCVKAQWSSILLLLLDSESPLGRCRLCYFTQHNKMADLQKSWVFVEFMGCLIHEKNGNQTTTFLALSIILYRQERGQWNWQDFDWTLMEGEEGGSAHRYFWAGKKVTISGFSCDLWQSHKTYPIMTIYWKWI